MPDDRKSETADSWTLARAVQEATKYALIEWSGAWVFHLIDGTYGWANCHPGWGWLRPGEEVVLRVRHDGVAEAFNG